MLSGWAVDGRLHGWLRNGQVLLASTRALCIVFIDPPLAGARTVLRKLRHHKSERLLCFCLVSLFGPCHGNTSSSRFQCRRADAQCAYLHWNTKNTNERGTRWDKRWERWELEPYRCGPHGGIERFFVVRKIPRRHSASVTTQKDSGATKTMSVSGRLVA
jgi:hypothetical protein